MLIVKKKVKRLFIEVLLLSDYEEIIYCSISTLIISIMSIQSVNTCLASQVPMLIDILFISNKDNDNRG